MRYADPKPHIRLRFKGESEQLVGQLIPALHLWAQRLLEEGWIHDIMFSAYEREIERYGGELLIDFAEKLFHQDSRSVIYLMSSMARKSLTFSEEVIAALSLIDYLKGFGLDINQQIAFFTPEESLTSELSGFRQNKSPLISLGEAILENNLAASSKDGAILHEPFCMRRADIQKMAEQLQEAKDRNRLISPPHLVQSSILHMHCNRFLGVEARKEIKARVYVYQTLKVINEKQRRLSVNTSIR